MSVAPYGESTSLLYDVNSLCPALHRPPVYCPHREHHRMITSVLHLQLFSAFMACDLLLSAAYSKESQMQPFIFRGAGCILFISVCVFFFCGRVSFLLLNCTLQLLSNNFHSKFHHDSSLKNKTVKKAFLVVKHNFTVSRSEASWRTFCYSVLLKVISRNDLVPAALWFVCIDEHVAPYGENLE